GLAGDLAGTIGLLVDTERNGQSASGETPPLSRLIEDRLLPLRDAPEEQKRRAVLELWDALDRREIFLLDKLLTGELRVGVSGTLAIRALAQHAGLPPATIAHRLMGSWQPSAAGFAALVKPGESDADVSRPYPFFLASQLEEEPEALGDGAEFLAAW